MRFDTGASDRQRRLAANEDAACAIGSGWAPGNAESYGAWQIWLATHCVSREAARQLLGLDPIVASRKPEWIGKPVATSEYEQRSLDYAVWHQLENGDVLGVATYGTFWLIKADEYIPQVLLTYPNETQLALGGHEGRSSCCSAPIETVLDAPTGGHELRIDEITGPPSMVALIPTFKRCRQCQSRLTP